MNTCWYWSVNRLVKEGLGLWRNVNEVQGAWWEVSATAYLYVWMKTFCNAKESKTWGIFTLSLTMNKVYLFIHQLRTEKSCMFSYGFKCIRDAPVEINRFLVLFWPIFISKLHTNCTEIIYQNSQKWMRTDDPLEQIPNQSQQAHCSQCSKHWKKNIYVEFGVELYMNLSKKGTDCFQKSFDGIFFSSSLNLNEYLLLCVQQYQKKH